MFYPFSISRLGLDIDSDEIRLFQLRKSLKKYYVENLATVLLPEGAIVEGRIKDFKAIQASLSSIVKKTKTRGYKTTIALPINQVITKRINLPIILDSRECELEISSNFNKYFPGIREEIYFDFKMLSGDKHHHEILLTVARREQIDSYVAVVEAAGLRVIIVDIDIYALLQVCHYMQRDKSVAIIKTTTDAMQIVIVHEQQIFINQQSPLEKNNNVALQIKRNLQQIFLAHPGLEIEWMLHSGKKNILDSDNLLTQIHPLKKIKKSCHVNSAALERQDSHLLVAFGLALRGCHHA